MSYIHLGPEQIDRYELQNVVTPPPVGPWHHPYSFADFADRVADSLQVSGLEVVDEAYGLTHENKRMFGLMTVEPTFEFPEHHDYRMLVGLRGSHDQSIARGLVAGQEVTVCSNLCFSGEINLSTRQTTHIERRLPGMIHDAVQNLRGVFEVQDRRNQTYKDTAIKPRWADAAITEMVRRRIINPSHVGKVIKEWDEPSFEEHNQYGDSVWKLFNGVTQTLKAPLGEHGVPMRMTAPVTADRTIGLTKFLDEVVESIH